jgi:hypothetical protein
MNWQTLFANLPVASLLGWLAAVGIPYLSALATRSPGHLTGVITAVLSLVDGFIVQLVNQNGGYNVGAAVGQAFLVWFTATKWHSKVLAGTQTEATLHQMPRRAPAPPQQAAA